MRTPDRGARSRSRSVPDGIPNLHAFPNPDCRESDSQPCQDQTTTPRSSSASMPLAAHRRDRPRTERRSLPAEAVLAYEAAVMLASSERVRK